MWNRNTNSSLDEPLAKRPSYEYNAFSSNHGSPNHPVQTSWEQRQTHFTTRSPATPAYHQPLFPILNNMGKSQNHESFGQSPTHSHHKHSNSPTSYSTDFVKTSHRNLESIPFFGSKDSSSSFVNKNNCGGFSNCVIPGINDTDNHHVQQMDSSETVSEQVSNSDLYNDIPNPQQQNTELQSQSNAKMFCMSETATSSQQLNIKQDDSIANSSQPAFSVENSTSSFLPSISQVLSNSKMLDDLLSVAKTIKFSDHSKTLNVTSSIPINRNVAIVPPTSFRGNSPTISAVSLTRAITDSSRPYYSSPSSVKSFGSNSAEDKVMSPFIGENSRTSLGSNTGVLDDTYKPAFDAGPFNKQYEETSLKTGDTYIPAFGGRSVSKQYGESPSKTDDGYKPAFDVRSCSKQYEETSSKTDDTYKSSFDVGSVSKQYGESPSKTDDRYKPAFDVRSCSKQYEETSSKSDDTYRIAFDVGSVSKQYGDTPSKTDNTYKPAFDVSSYSKQYEDIPSKIDDTYNPTFDSKSVNKQYEGTSSKTDDTWKPIFDTMSVSKQYEETSSIIDDTSKPAFDVGSFSTQCEEMQSETDTTSKLDFDVSSFSKESEGSSSKTVNIEENNFASLSNGQEDNVIFNDETSLQKSDISSGATEDPATKTASPIPETEEEIKAALFDSLMKCKIATDNDAEVILQVISSLTEMYLRYKLHFVPQKKFQTLIESLKEGKEKETNFILNFLKLKPIPPMESKYEEKEVIPAPPPPPTANEDQSTVQEPQRIQEPTEAAMVPASSSVNSIQHQQMMPMYAMSGMNMPMAYWMGPTMAYMCQPGMPMQQAMPMMTDMTMQQAQAMSLMPEMPMQQPPLPEASVQPPLPEAAMQPPLPSTPIQPPPPPPQLKPPMPPQPSSSHYKPLAPPPIPLCEVPLPPR